MKKSEFIEDYKRQVAKERERVYASSSAALRAAAETAAVAAERAGVQWDPEGREEPELPGRLTLEEDSLGGIIIEGVPGQDEPWIDLSLVTGERPLHPEEIQRLKELLARYNLVDSLNLGKADERDLFAADVLRKWLHGEREKLR